MTISTIYQTNTGRDRTSDVGCLSQNQTTQLSAVLGNLQARPLANRPYLLRRGARYCPAILCCDTVLRAIESFKTSIEPLNRFPQSTSLAKINRWMLDIAVFRRSNWLLQGLHEAQKMPRSAHKVTVSLNMVQQLRHSLEAACLVCEPRPNIRQGHRRHIAKPYPWLNVKVAVTSAGKTQAKMLVVYCIVLQTVFTHRIKQADDR